MRPKEYLNLARRYHESYKRALDDVENIRELMQSAGAIRYDKDQIQRSPSNDQMVNYMIRLERAEEKARAAAENYFDFYLTVRSQIEEISPGLYSDVLYLRYIKGMPLTDICEELNYSYDWIRRIHGRALVAFGKHFPEILKKTQKDTFKYGIVYPSKSEKEETS